MSEQSYDIFLKAHKSHLETLNVPESFWPILFDKLKEKKQKRITKRLLEKLWKENNLHLKVNVISEINVKKENCVELNDKNSLNFLTEKSIKANDASPVKAKNSNNWVMPPSSSPKKNVSRVHSELQKNFGHPLPKKLDALLHLFTTMENIVFVKYGRNMRTTFEYASKNVMKCTKMSFSQDHLSKIMGVYPNAYKLRWEQRRQQVGKQTKANFDLILEPNLMDDITEFYCQTSTTKLSAERKTYRKMIFRHYLVLKVKEAHSNFLKSKNISLASGDILHPDFDIDSVDELPCGCIPVLPDSGTALRSASEYFRMIPKSEETLSQSQVKALLTPVKVYNKLPQSPVKVVNGLLQSPIKVYDGNLLKSPSKTAKIPPISNSINPIGTPKMSLLERIRAREKSQKILDKSKNIELEKQRDVLQLLKKSMIEVICSHFTLHKVHGMNLRSLMPLVILACGQLDKEKFNEHIDALCEAAPKFCRKESMRDEFFLKISEVRVDKLKQCVEDRLESVERELRVMN